MRALHETGNSVAQLGRLPAGSAGGVAAVIILAVGAMLSACGGSPAAPSARGSAGDTPSVPPTALTMATMAMPTARTAAPAQALPAGGAAGTVGGIVVGIDNFAFVPATLTVTVGTTVTWTNHDDVPHTVTSTDNRFASSPALDTDEHFTSRFTAPGTYAYFCSLHPQMTATIIVR